jgi:hypothetical protein
MKVVANTIMLVPKNMKEVVIGYQCAAGQLHIALLHIFQTRVQHVIQFITSITIPYDVRTIELPVYRRLLKISASYDEQRKRRLIAVAFTLVANY